MNEPASPAPLDVLSSLGCPSVLVVGDLILDRYCWGTVDRISPEAPVPVLRFERSEDRLGGAAAVAMLLQSLGCLATCCGVVGTDAEGETIRTLLSGEGVDACVIEPDSTRPTTVKQRFLSSPHGHAQLLRVDRESVAPISQRTYEALASGLVERIAASQAVLISDYGKGVCTPRLLEFIVATAKARGVPVIVDPARGAAYRCYEGVDIIVPNRIEAQAASAQSISNHHEAASAGKLLCGRHGIRATIIKLDSDGMLLVESNGRSKHFPTRARAVYDITGAGDAVLAVLGLCIAERVPLDIACPLANSAGGVQVERVGVARITREDLRRDLQSDCGNHWNSQTPSKFMSLAAAAGLSKSWRQAGLRVIFTNGCFAAVHAGHVAYLREASRLGDRLIVAANSEASIRRLKGDRPIIFDSDRANLLAALDFVDAVLLFDEDTPQAVLEAIRPDVLVKGGTTETVVGREFVESYGGCVRILAAVPGVSTTQLLGR